MIPLDQFSGASSGKPFPGPTGTVKCYLLLEGQRIVMDIDFFFFFFLTMEGLACGEYLIRVYGGYEVTSAPVASFPYSQNKLCRLSAIPLFPREILTNINNNEN